MEKYYLRTGDNFTKKFLTIGITIAVLYAALISWIIWGNKQLPLIQPLKAEEPNPYTYPVPEGGAKG